ncbi:hypothetical protein NFI96_021399 [Prochilodus magdalenae]|nr:hypothetical protein NFI96_021399 [Prochilodus magdalenae]
MWWRPSLAQFRGEFPVDWDSGDSCPDSVPDRLYTDPGSPSSVTVSPHVYTVPLLQGRFSEGLGSEGPAHLPCSDVQFPGVSRCPAERMSVRIQEFMVIVWQTTRTLPPKMTCLLHSPARLTCVSFLVLLGFLKLAGISLTCPCKPGVNEAFAAAMFIVPSLLLFTVMLYLTRPFRIPCVRWSCGTRFAEGLLPCLIPPTLWVILLLLDGQYVACALTYWKGRYILDEDKPPLLWCEPSSSRESVEKALYRRFIGWSQVSGLVLICSICIVTILVVSRRDCRQASEGTTPEEWLDVVLGCRR